MQGDVYVEPTVLAWDDCDGDLSDSVVVEGSVNAEVPGIYVVVYMVWDSAGNSAETVRVVTVYEKVKDVSLVKVPFFSFNGR